MYNVSLPRDVVQQTEQRILHVWKDGKPRPLTACLRIVKREEIPTDIAVKTLIQILAQGKLEKYDEEKHEPGTRPRFVLRRR